MPDGELTQAERDRQTALKCAREGFCLGYRMGSGYTVSIPNLEPGTEGLEVCLKSRAVEAEQREGALREALDVIAEHAERATAREVGGAKTQMGDALWAVGRKARAALAAASPEGEAS